MRQPDHFFGNGAGRRARAGAHRVCRFETRGATISILAVTARLAWGERGMSRTANVHGSAGRDCGALEAMRGRPSPVSYTNRASLSVLGPAGLGFITPARQGGLSVRLRWNHLFWVSYPE